MMAVHNEHKFISFPGFSETVSFDDDDFEDDGNNFIISLEESGDEDARQSVVHAPAPVSASQSTCHLNNTTQGLENERQLTAHSNFDVQRTNSHSFDAHCVSTFSNSDFSSTTSNNNTTSQQNNMPASVRSVPNENWPNAYNISKEMQWNRVFYSSVSNDNPESTGGFASDVIPGFAGGFASVSNIGSNITIHNNTGTTRVKPQLFHSEDHSVKNLANSEHGNVCTEKCTVPDTHLKTKYSDLLHAYMTTPNTSLFYTNRSPCESIPFHKTGDDWSTVNHVTAEKQNSLLGNHNTSNLPACNVPKLSGPYPVNGRKEVGGDSVVSEKNVNSALGNVSEFKIYASSENTECTCIMCYKSSRVTSYKEPAVNETNLTITHPAKKRRIKKSVADGDKKSWPPNVTVTSYITPTVSNVAITSQIIPDVTIIPHITPAVSNVAITSYITPTVPNVAITSHITPAVSNVTITSQALPVVSNVAVPSQMQTIQSDSLKQAQNLLNGKVNSYEHCSVYPAAQATQHTDILERHGTSLINPARVQEVHKMDPNNGHKQTSSVAGCDSMNSTHVVASVNKPYLQCQTLATAMPAVSRVVPVTSPSPGSVFSVYKSQPTKVFLKPAEASRNKLQSLSCLPVLSPSHQSNAGPLHACTTGQESSPIKGTAQISTSNSPVSSPPIYKIIYVSSDQVLVCPSQASSARPVPASSQIAKPNTHQHATFVKLPDLCIPASREKPLDTSFVLHHSNKVDLPSSHLLTKKCEPFGNTKDTNVHQELRHVLRSAEKIDISRPGEVLIKLKHPLDTGRHRTVINESTQTAAKIIDKIIIPAPMISLLKDFKSPQINNSDSTPSSPIAHASVVSNPSQSNTPGNHSQSNTPGNPSQSNTPGNPSQSNTPGNPSQSNTPGNHSQSNTTGKHTVAYRNVEFTQTLMGLIKSHIQEQMPVSSEKILMNIIKGGLKTRESSKLSATHQDTGGGGDVSRLHESAIQKPKEEEEVWCRSDDDDALTSEVCSPSLPREGLPSTYIEDWVQQAKSYSAEHLQDDNFMPDHESQNTTMSTITTLDTHKLCVKSSTDNGNIHFCIQPQTESTTRSSVQNTHESKERKFINLSELHVQKPSRVQSLELQIATEPRTTDSDIHLQNLIKPSGLPTTSHTSSGTLQNHVQSVQKSHNEPLQTLSSSTIIADSRGIKLKIRLSELRKNKIKYKGSQKSSDQVVKVQQAKDECPVQKTNSVAQQNPNGGAAETKSAVDNLEHKKRTETAEEMFQRFQDQAVQEVFNAQLGVGYVSRSLRPGRSTMTFLDKYPYSFDTVYPKKKINNENGPQGGTKQTGDVNKCQVLPTEQQNMDCNKQKNKRPMEEDSCEETTVKYPKVSVMDYPSLKQDCSITNRRKLICSDILAAHKVYVKFNTFENVYSGRSFLVPFFNIGGRRTQFDVEDMEYISQSVMEFEKEERACARHLLFHAREGQKAAFLRRETQFQAGHINERNYKKFSFILEGFRREAIKHAEVPPEQWKVDNCVDIEIDRAEIYNDAEMEFDDSMNDVVCEQQIDKENKLPRQELECEQVNDSNICTNNTDFEISNAQTNQTCTSDNVSNASAPDDAYAVDYTGELIAQVKQEILDISYGGEDQAHPQNSSSMHLSSASNCGKELGDKSVFIKQEPMDDYFDSASATEVCSTSSALATSSTKVCSISASAAVYAASAVSSADISKLTPGANNSMHINNTPSQVSVVSSEKPFSLHIPSHRTCSDKDISTISSKPSTPDYISMEKSRHGVDVDKVLPSANVETDGNTLPAEMASEKRPDSILAGTAEIKTVLDNGRLESNLASQTNVECKYDTIDDALSMGSSTEELSSPESPFPSSSLTSESSEISASNDENLQSSESGWTSTSHTSLALPEVEADSGDGANKHNNAQSKITSLVESLKNRLTQDIPSLPAWLSSMNPSATNVQMKRKKLKTHERERVKTSAEILNANDKSISAASTDCHTKPSFTKQASILCHIQSVKPPEFLPTSTPHITQPVQNMPLGPSVPSTAKISSMLLPVKEPETVQKFALDHTSTLQKDHRDDKDSLLQTDKMRSSVALPGASKEIKEAGFESFQTKEKRISEPETLPDICESKMLNKSNISNVEDKELLYAEYKAYDDFYNSDQLSPVDLEIDVADQDLLEMASPIDFEIEVGEEDLPEMAMRLQPVLPHIDPYKKSENWTRENSNKGLNNKQTSLQICTVLPSTSTNTKSLSHVQDMSRKIGRSSFAEKGINDTGSDHQYVLTERKKPMKGPVTSYLRQKFSLADEKGTFKGPRLLHVPASYGNKETSTQNLSSRSQSESTGTAELSRTPTIDEIFGAGQRKDPENEHNNNTSGCHIPAPKQKKTSHQIQVAKKKTSLKKKRRSTVHSANGSELKSAGIKLSISSNLKPNAQPHLSHKNQVSAGPSIQPCKVVLTKLEDMGIVATDRISCQFIFKVQQKYRNSGHSDWQITEENSNSSFGDRSLETRRKVVKRKRKKLVLGTKRNLAKPKRDIIDYYTAMLKNLQKKAQQLEEESKRKAEEDAKRKLEEEIKKKAEENAKEKLEEKEIRENAKENVKETEPQVKVKENAEQKLEEETVGGAEEDTEGETLEKAENVNHSLLEETGKHTEDNAQGKSEGERMEKTTENIKAILDVNEDGKQLHEGQNTENKNEEVEINCGESAEERMKRCVHVAVATASVDSEHTHDTMSRNENVGQTDWSQKVLGCPSPNVEHARNESSINTDLVGNEESGQNAIHSDTNMSLWPDLQKLCDETIFNEENENIDSAVCFIERNAASTAVFEKKDVVLGSSVTDELFHGRLKSPSEKLHETEDTEEMCSDEHDRDQMDEVELLLGLDIHKNTPFSNNDQEGTCRNLPSLDVSSDSILTHGDNTKNAVCISGERVCDFNVINASCLPTYVSENITAIEEKATNIFSSCIAVSQTAATRNLQPHLDELLVSKSTNKSDQLPPSSFQHVSVQQKNKVLPPVLGENFKFKFKLPAGILSRAIKMSKNKSNTSSEAVQDISMINSTVIPMSIPQDQNHEASTQQQNSCTENKTDCFILVESAQSLNTSLATECPETKFTLNPSTLSAIRNVKAEYLRKRKRDGKIRSASMKKIKSPSKDGQNMESDLHIPNTQEPSVLASVNVDSLYKKLQISSCMNDHETVISGVILENITTSSAISDSDTTEHQSKNTEVSEREVSKNLDSKTTEIHLQETESSRGENSTAFGQHSVRQARKDGIFSSIDLLQDLVDVQASMSSTNRLSEVNNESNISRIPEIESIVNKLPESNANRPSEVNRLAKVNKNIKTNLIDLSKLKLKLNPFISSKLKERVSNKQTHDTEKQSDTSNKVSPCKKPDLNKLSNQHVSDPEHSSLEHVAQCHTMDDVKETGPKSCTTGAQHLNAPNTRSDIKETIHQSSSTNVQPQHTNPECRPVLQLNALKLCNFLKNFHKNVNTGMKTSIRKTGPALPCVNSHNETSKTSDQVVSTTSLQIPIELPLPTGSVEHNTKVDSQSAIIDEGKVKTRTRRAKQKANQNLINSSMPPTACVKLDTSKEAAVVAEDKSKGDDKSVRSVFDCLPALPLDVWENKSNVN